MQAGGVVAAVVLNGLPGAWMTVLTSGRLVVAQVGDLGHGNRLCVEDGLIVTVAVHL